MSDVLGDYSPLAGLTPEEALQTQRDMYGRVLKFANSAASMPITLVAPDPRLTDMTGGPKALNYLPFTGAAEGIVGLGGALLNAGSTLGNMVTQPYGINIPKVPMGAAEHFDKTRQEIQTQIGEHTPLPKPDLTDEADRYTDLAGAIAGGIIPVAPGGFAAALPYGLRTLGGFMVPSVGHTGTNAVIATGLGGAATGLQVAKDALAQPTDKPVDFNTFLSQPDTPTPTPTPTPIQPEAFNPQTSLNAALSGETAPPGPTFSGEGTTGHTLLDALFTIGGVLTAIGAVKFMHGIKGAATDIDRAARFNDPAYAQQATDYNNAVIKRGGDISSGMEPPTPPPLPEANRFRQGTNAANTQVLNENAQMQDAIRAIAEPSAAERIAHMYGNVHTDAAHEVRVNNFNETGFHEPTGIRIPKPAELYRDIAGLK